MVEGNPVEIEMGVALARMVYKQGSEGDVSGPKPGFFDFVGTAKYEAWAKLKGTPSAEARQRYIELVRSLGA